MKLKTITLYPFPFAKVFRDAGKIIRKQELQELKLLDLLETVYSKV